MSNDLSFTNSVTPKKAGFSDLDGLIKFVMATVHAVLISKANEFWCTFRLLSACDPNFGN